MSATDDGATAVGVELERPAADKPLVSVIVPAYNAEVFLEETLLSAVRQTYEPLEIIVVDDGSTDRTVEIVRGVMARDRRVKLVQQANAGVAAARNRGLREAQGSLIAPLDADDLWKPTKIERQVACFLAAADNADNADNLALVYTWSHNIDETGGIMRWKKNRPDVEGRAFHNLIEANFIGNGSTPLMRKDYVLEAGGYDPAFRAQDAEGCEDWKLYLALAERYEFAAVREPLVGYRQTPGMMSRNLWAMKRAYDLLFDEVRSRHPNLPEDVLRRNATFFAIWLASIDVAAYHLMVTALSRDPLCFVRRGVRRHLLLLPFHYTYHGVKRVWPGLGGRLERLRKTGRMPFLEETTARPPTSGAET
jgi:glycosyltransferase involved in cell wall biosynthesis